MSAKELDFRNYQDACVVPTTLSGLLNQDCMLKKKPNNVQIRATIREIPMFIHANTDPSSVQPGQVCPRASLSKGQASLYQG